MKKTLITLGIVFGVALILFFVFKNNYNAMIEKEQTVEEAWSTVETQYQRRNDLYKNVVSTIKGSKEFEQETLTSVVEARSKATSMNISADQLTPENIQRFQEAQNQLSGAFSRLLLTVERYPELKTTGAFREFQTQIEGTENRINKARKDFNGTVRDYNTYIKKFPNNIFAGIFGFDEKGYFKAAEGTDQAPDIEF
jgi:LemA protein